LPRFMAQFCDLLCKREFRIVNTTEELRTAPCRPRLQFCASPNDIKTVTAEFEQKIAPVLSLAALSSGKKLRRAPTHCNVDLASIYEFSRDLAKIVRISRVCVKGGACWIS